MRESPRRRRRPWCSKGGDHVEGLMMETQLTIPELIVSRAERYFAHRPVVSRVGDIVHRSTWGEVTRRAQLLAGALRSLGVRPGDRVGTFAWNTHHHLEAYWAVPLMGAVLHTVNFRLSPADVTYIVNHGGASVLLVGASVWPLLAPIRKALTTVREIVVIR